MVEIADNTIFDVKINLGKIDPSIINGANLKDINYLVNHDDIYLWWKDIGKVKISKGSQITVELLADLENTKNINIIPFLLGPVMSLLLHQRGYLVLHGSSVRINDGAVAFLGHRGNGKSTTALGLYKAKYPLVTDDILAIKFDIAGQAIVYPGYPHVRLSEDSYNQFKDNTDILTPIRTIIGKVFCDASVGFSTEPVSLKRVYIIEKGVRIGLHSLRSHENLINLIIHSVANRIFEPTTQAENLKQCATLINNVSMQRLDIPHSFKELPEVLRLIEEDFKR